MRKLLLATIMAAVFVSGSIAGMIPFASAASGGGDPINQLVRRFNHIADIVQSANERFDKISADIQSDPGPTSDPAVIQSLQTIKNQADTLSQKAQNLLLCTPIGCP